MWETLLREYREKLERIKRRLDEKVGDVKGRFAEKRRR